MWNKAWKIYIYYRQYLAHKDLKNTHIVESEVNYSTYRRNGLNTQCTDTDLVE